MDFYSSINRLDYTYADQRQLYVLLEQLKIISQRKKPLAEFHGEVYKALILTLTKIEMCSEDNNEGTKNYTNQEAVRTFILGLNSKYTSGILYRHNPRNLKSAYARAYSISHVIKYSRHRTYNSDFKSIGKIGTPTHNHIGKRGIISQASEQKNSFNQPQINFFNQF